MNNRAIFFALLSGLVSLPSQAASEVHDVAALRERLGVTGDANADLKIAILDNGFGDFETRPVGTYLPVSAAILPDYAPETGGNALSSDRHGLSMAQIVWAMTGRKAEGPQFYLLNANGFTQFQRAVRAAIDLQVDIILYSQNWEYGGNFDGRGFINAVVSEATDAGILWVNAAGNYGGSVYDARLSDRASIRFSNRFEENPVQFVVSWSDFTDVENTQTSLDVDVEVVNSRGEVVAQGNRSQVVVPGAVRGECSLHARELFTATLDRGDYTVRFIRRAGTFPRGLRVRAFIQADRSETPIEFTDATEEREIMIPADHPQVITVGDLSDASAHGPTVDGRSKPEILIEDSTVSFTSGLSSRGTSNAAAMFVGALAVLKSTRPELTREQVLGLRQEQGSCLFPASRDRVSTEVWSFLEEAYSRNRESFPVGTARDGRVTVLVPTAPLELSVFASLRDWVIRNGLAPSLMRTFLASATEAWVVPMTMTGSGPTLPGDLLQGGGFRWVEVIERGRGVRVCASTDSRGWRLPVSVTP